MAMMIIIFGILLLTLSVTGYMVYQLRQQPRAHVSRKDTIRLVGTGILAFISDTLGMGSFAVNIALAKILGTFSDEELPAMNNGAQLIPGAIESLFFMQFVEVDLTTLVVLDCSTHGQTNRTFGYDGLFYVYYLSIGQQPIRFIASWWYCYCLIFMEIGDRFLWCHALWRADLGRDWFVCHGASCFVCLRRITFGGFPDYDDCWRNAATSDHIYVPPSCTQYAN